MKRFLIPILIIFLALLMSRPLCAPSGASPFDSGGSVGRPDRETVFRMPGFIQRSIAAIVRTQRNLHRSIVRTVRSARNGGKLPVFPLLAVSFLYGLVHAAGPGHGKVILSSYLVSPETGLLRAVLLGNVVALLHGLSALLLALILWRGTSHLQLVAPGRLHFLKLASSAGITLLGLFLLLKTLSSRRDGVPSHACEKGTFRSSGLIPLILTVGMVPCSGVMLLLFFALSAGISWLALPMVAMMILGMAVTLSAVSAVTVLGRKGMIHLGSRGSRRREGYAGALRIASALLLLLIGGTLLISNLFTI